jgi:hypothetical protein
LPSFWGKGDGTFHAAVNYTIGCRKGTVSVLLGNGDGTLQAGTDFIVGRTPIAVAVGQLNKDRAPDLAEPIKTPTGSASS